MHYEKKWLYKTSKQKMLANAALAIVALTVILLLLYIHAPHDFWWPMKFIDIINVIAQLATAAAFFLAIYQYKKNSDSERQKVLIDEARTLITKMKTISESFSGIEGPSRKQAMSFMNDMTSHAGNFNAIFASLNEGIHKAIIRMHWQDMYFKELHNAIQYFNATIDITKFKVHQTEYLKALSKFSSLKNNNGPAPIFSNYIMLQYMINISFIREKTQIDNDDHLTLYLFEKTFLDNDTLKDHLFGCLNHIDIRVRAPLIAVINELYSIQPQTRDSQAYKTFYPIPA
ncbi:MULTISPECIES: hypothetical protein [unclassified Pseudomonas]|uniref:hypothetical protein n=1 Tax=unclassified Pseudomonas TaxID=196821 RepID=UPI0030DC872A